MAIRKEKEEVSGWLFSTRAVYITEDGKRFYQESEAFLHDEYLKWQQTARKMGVRCIDGGYYCESEQALAAVVIMMSYKTGRYDGKQKKFVKYDNYKNYRFSGPDWYFFEHDASKPYPYGYSVKSFTQKKQEFAAWLKKHEEKA